MRPGRRVGPCTSPPLTDWTSGSFDVTTYIGDPFRVRFRFGREDPISNDFLGWYVDDVVVTASG